MEIALTKESLKIMKQQWKKIHLALPILFGLTHSLFSNALWLASLKKTQFWHSGRFSAVSADELALLMNHFIQCVFFCPRARKACARVSRWGLSGYDAFVCLLIGSCLSLLSVTSQARKAELGQSEPSIQIARPDKEQLAAGAAHAFLF